MEVQEEEEGNEAVKEKNHGSQAGIKMKQKKHNLGHTKIPAIMKKSKVSMKH